MTETYIDSNRLPLYTGTEVQQMFATSQNLDNRSKRNDGTDVLSQIGANMIQAFIQTMMGSQHLRGDSANDIAQKAYMMAYNQCINDRKQSMTFAQWAEEYMDVYETGCSEETKRKMYVYIRKHLIPFFGQMDIAQITQTDVQRFSNRKGVEISSATGRPYSHKTLKHLLDTMKKIMDRALIAGYIQRNPVVKIKNNAKPAPRRKGSTEAAQGAMIAILPTVVDPMVRLWATISLASGMRAQEIAALRWSDVDWKAGCFHVTEAITWHNNRPTVKSTKTEAGVRHIPFQDWAVDLMKPLACEQGYILRPHKGVVDGSQPISASAYRRLADKFQETLSVYGLPRYTAHIGRHTMANTLDKVGASEKSIELISGHTDAEFTRSQYMNAEFEQTKRDMQKVSEFNKWLAQQSDAKIPKISAEDSVK